MSDDSSQHALKRRPWMPVAWATGASVLASIIGRLTNFAHRREVPLALFYAVMVIAGGHYSQKLYSHPARTIVAALFGAAVGVAIMQIGT